jgi:hypothetical protein
LEVVVPKGRFDEVTVHDVVPQEQFQTVVSVELLVLELGFDEPLELFDVEQLLALPGTFY